MSSPKRNLSTFNPFLEDDASLVWFDGPGLLRVTGPIITILY